MRDILAARNACILFAVLLLPVIACDREHVTVDDTPPESAWSYGEARTLEVPAAVNVTVIDSVSASIFRLATGGGSLTVRDILSGPSTLEDEDAFAIEYTGDSAVELLIPHQPGDVVYLTAYAPLTDVVLEYAPPDTFDWMALPAGDTLSGPGGDTLVVALPLGSGAGAGKSRDGFSKREYKRLVYDKTTGHDVVVAQIEANIRSACLSLIEAIPVARQEEVRARINGPMRPSYYVPKNRTAWFWTAKPEYMPYHPERGAFSVYQIVIPDDHVSSVAHETSHYFHHVLLQDDFRKFANHARPDHKIGKPGALNELIEDMAYLGEYYLNGNVSGTNPTWGSTLAGIGAGAKHPWTSDFRDLEGMAMAVFAAHTREQDWVNDYTGRRRTVPVIPGEVTEKFRDCYEIVAQGTDDVIDVVEKLEATLQAKYGKAEALPAMLEPLGWTHHVKVRFVDGANRGVPGVRARSVCKTPLGEFHLPRRETPTGDDGEYALSAFFPKKSTLRVYIGPDSMDIREVTIPWTTPTTQEIRIPDVVLGTGGILITSIDPAAAPPGTDVWIAGSGFGTTPGMVYFGALQAAEIQTWRDYGVRAVIPAGTPAGPTAVTARVGERTSNSYTLFVEDELFAALHDATRAEVDFYAWHSYDPWDAGEEDTFSQVLQHISWNGAGFSGEEVENTDQRRLKITCAGTVDLAQRTLNFAYEVVDTTLVLGEPYVLRKKASFVNLPFHTLNGGTVEFKAVGAAVQGHMGEPLEWTNTGYGGGQYTETHWDWFPEDNRLIITFRRQ